MAFLNVKNRAKSTLAADITDIATSLTVATNEGAKFPTASELYIQTEYLDQATTGHRAKSTASTQTLTNNTDWVGFTTSFSPGQSGWVYIKVFLKKYTANCGVYVDIRPVI